MKHTSFRLGFLILLFINLLTGKAQTPLTEGGGPKVERCSAALSNSTLLKQDEKSAVFYLNTYSNNPKQQYQVKPQWGLTLVSHFGFPTALS